MSDEKKPEPAFPHPYRDVPGMTLHDYVAVQAMVGLLEGETVSPAVLQWAARESFSMADAFMAERAERAKGAKP